MNTLRIGLVSVSDRASGGIYQDKGIPALETRLIPDEQSLIEETLCELVDAMRCQLVLTTGGTGPAWRDVTPDATRAVADREMPGFGEQMRQISLHFVPTAILSRQVGVIRKQSLILDLPRQPKSIQETLEGVKDEQGNIIVVQVFLPVYLIAYSFLMAHILRRPLRSWPLFGPKMQSARQPPESHALAA